MLVLTLFLIINILSVYVLFSYILCCFCKEEINNENNKWQPEVNSREFLFHLKIDFIFTQQKKSNIFSDFVIEQKTNKKIKINWIIICSLPLNLHNVYFFVVFLSAKNKACLNGF